MARIAIDVDGVLANFTKAFVEKANEIWPGRLALDYEPIDWGWTDSGFSKAEIKQTWKRINATENFWLSLDAHSDNVGSLAQWMVSHANHDIWLCTARAEGAGMTAAKQTEIWINSTGVRAVNNFMGIITVSDGNRKAQLYEAAHIEWSVDDKPETIIDCGLIGTFHHHAYLLNRRHNSLYSVHDRVESVAQFLEKIK